MKFPIVKIILQEKGIRQIDLARKFGISKSYISYIVCGEKKPTKLRKKIAQELRIPEDYFDKKLEVGV